jgi:hypothetical protein
VARQLIDIDRGHAGSAKAGVLDDFIGRDGAQPVDQCGRGPHSGGGQSGATDEIAAGK